MRSTILRYYVYILLCADGSYYTGRSTDPERRVSEHNLGLGGDYTKRRRPVRLVWSGDFATEEEAYAVERQLKGWTRAKKEALIRGDFDLLHELAKSTYKKAREKQRAAKKRPKNRNSV
jgi:putative endonuclease